ncbi:MAG: FHA domain-containing protein [Thermodesulfobacteriota bacterium]
MFKVILKFQDTVLQEFVFEHSPVTIGRRDGNDIAIDNMAVSGKHAQIETEGADRYVLVDLESLNGTFVNDKKVSREALHSGDSILIGKHHLEFRDLGKAPRKEQAAHAKRKPDEKQAKPKEIVKEQPKEEGPPAAPLPPPEPEPRAPAQEAASAPAKEPELELAPTEGEMKVVEEPEQPLPQRTKRPELKGTLTILSGGVPQIIDLTKMVTTLGKSDEADVKCSGMLVGKMAAIINRTPYGFFLKYHEGTKKPQVNGDSVSSQVQLQDGDEIAIGGTRLTFNMTEGN